ncbi:TonB-dependent siderophore receptor [Pleionea sp. CnH1-48]|uniref:TonB-dependent receptor n=1 Tax=Pleionea sp. CnH1-48 TaxID=2954494 RepID=UPI0020972790|nr:TonB-dependent receptor [Pleionea sp. CnH1-48]MCO7223397.1 TonB-dependent receptor [Pleionea sp. CnH1-48]
MLNNRRVVLLIGYVYFCHFPVIAHSAPEDDDLMNYTLEQLLHVRVTGAAVRELGLKQTPQTGNPAQLKLLDLPMSVDIIDSQTTRARGLKSVTEAAENLVGVISGESPAEPSSFSMRGFSRDSVIILRDGIRTGPASMTMRPQNTFNLKQVEVIKGPSTLNYGSATASGVINMITKKPVINDGTTVEFFGSNATFSTSEWGFGVNSGISNSSAIRIDLNQSLSNGWVDDTESSSINLTASALKQFNNDLTMELSFDYLKDDLPAYWGTPLVPASFARSPLSGIVTTDDGRVLDDAMRINNYNVDDQSSESEHLWSRLMTRWAPSKDFELKLNLYHFHASRAWKNAESYVFNETTELLDRDRFFVFHHHDLYGFQLDGHWQSTLGDMPNHLHLGIDYNKTDFVRDRGFPDGDSVDPFNPSAGLFGPLDKRSSPTKIDVKALILQNSLSLTERWRLDLGVRDESIQLTRDNFDVDGSFITEDSFARTFKPTSYRLASSYKLQDNLSVYAQWSTGHDPVGSNILLVNANENFDFTDIRQYEVGLKYFSPDGKIELTTALYDIQRSDFLLLVTHDTVGNSGQQDSQGIELAVSSQLTDNFRLGGNIAYTDAKYGEFVDPDFGIDATNNTPPNVPDIVANLWFSHNNPWQLPVEVGAGLRYVSDRFSNFQNTVTFREYYLTNFFVAYQKDKDTRIALNVRNLFDERYAPWADIFYPNQVAIGAPRTLEVSFHTKF